MTLTLDNHSQTSQTRESSLTKALRQIQHLNSKVTDLERQHQDYVRSQQNLISAIAEICVSPMQEIEALRILICQGEAECRRYLRSLLINQKKASIKKEGR
ncbi:hypothetical protein [Nostoc sp.]|uniref:hypothetical protein n=1 Tax=Nostoc sp. TaxID=1180 RepID=UPI003592F61D